MPRGEHAFQHVPGGIPAAMLAGDTNKRFARCAASLGPVFVRMDVKPRRLARTVLQLVGVHVDHECAPILFASVIA
jgi:hypothetical protein